MSKRLAIKLAVMVAALGAVTLLPGCGGDEEGVNWTFVYMPVHTRVGLRNHGIRDG